MNICIILPCNIYNAPFYTRYVKLLRDWNVDFDLIYWNRANIKEITYAKSNYIYLNEDQVNSGSYKKILKYIGFSRFVKRHLQMNKYDRILFLGSYAGIMVLLSKFIKCNYYQQYWLDIRDFTCENIKPYYLRMQQAIENSAVTVISSVGYRTFLPKWDYVISHNIDKENIKNFLQTREVQRKQEQIRISFIGLVRYYEENQKLINALKNDSRFKLQYFGMNSEKIKDYCMLHGIKNTDFHGRFPPEQTAEFYKKTDLINNVYGSVGLPLTTALSNKLYFAASLGIPILVSKGTLMEKVACGYGFGYAIDFNNPKLADDLYKWYNNIDWCKLEQGCSDFMDKVYKEDKLFEDTLANFLQIGLV